ncbi:MAG: hypothetical protein ACTHJN_19315 [Ginsengibacter sp.]
MTKEQIDILVSDGDITPGFGMLFLKGETFEASASFNKILSEIFSWYSNNYCFGDALRKGECNIFKEKTLSRINEFLKNKDQKINFLNTKIQEQVLRLDNLQEENGTWGTTIKEIKEMWLFEIGCNESLENFIETLKFKVLKSKADFFKVPYYGISHVENFQLLDKYFYSKEMRKIFDLIAIDENIKFLQSEIKKLQTSDEVVNKSDSFTKGPTEVKGPNDLTIRQLSMYCYFKGIKVKYESGVEPTLSQLGYSRLVTQKMKKNLPEKYKEFEKTVNKDSNRTQRQASWLKKDFETILPLFHNDKPTQEIIQQHLSNL